MKRIFILTILGTLSNFSNAQNWLFITGHSKYADFYIDTTSRKKVTNSVYRIWIFQDLKSKMANGALSAKLLREIDCSEEKFRSLQYTFYSEGMLKGKVIQSTTYTSEWQYIEPGSMDRDVMEVVCPDSK